MKRLFKYGVACALDNPSRNAPIILRGNIEQVAATTKAIGYDGIELQIYDPQKYDWKNLTDVAQQHGLEYCAIATGRELFEHGLSLISDDAGVRRAAIDKLKVHIDLGAAIGCMVIIGTMRSNIPDMARYRYYEDLLTSAKLELADYAQTKAVHLVVENILRAISNYLNTMKEVTDYVNRLNRDNIGIHLDTFSMLAEDNDIAGCVRYCAKKLEYVHFSDSGRYYPGGGNVDFKTFMKALLEVGYTGYISTECIPFPDEYTCAKRGLDYMHALETCVVIERSSQR
ncbi:MAG: sugar phosphate isomerase/epimerase [Treponemataceae bacterium]